MFFLRVPLMNDDEIVTAYPVQAGATLVTKKGVLMLVTDDDKLTQFDLDSETDDG